MLWLGRTVGCFIPLEACMVTPGTMKASPQRGGIQVGSSSGTPGPVSEVREIFRVRDLPGNSNSL